MGDGVDKCYHWYVNFKRWRERKHIRYDNQQLMMWMSSYVQRVCRSRSLVSLIFLNRSTWWSRWWSQLESMHIISDEDIIYLRWWLITLRWDEMPNSRHTQQLTWRSIDVSVDWLICGGRDASRHRLVYDILAAWFTWVPPKILSLSCYEDGKYTPLWRCIS